MSNSIQQNRPEQWKDVLGYEGWYQVSSAGRIRSLERTVTQRSRWGIQSRIMPGKTIQPTDNGHGYKIVSLKKNGERKNGYVHRLVAEAFLEKKPGCDEVNHIDANPGNNHVTNLEWVNHQENISCAVPHMCHPKNARLPSTGHKYIRFRKGRYVVSIKPHKEKRFDHMEDAIAYKEVVLSGEQHLAD